MAKHKNHVKVGDRLLQTNKPFSQLKQSQKEKINEWLYDEYSHIYIIRQAHRRTSGTTMKYLMRYMKR